MSLAGDQSVQGEVLEDLRQAVNYRRWLASLATPWLGPTPLEVGSGTGDYAQLWSPYVREITVSEGDPRRVASLRRRFAEDPRVRVRELVAPITETGGHSSVVAYNVLEHIEDDVAALRGFAGLAAPGGRVILVVPAFPIAMSRFDRQIGHFRRYRRRTLLQALTAADLRVRRLHHVNAPGLVAWVVGMRLLGLRPRAGPLLTAWDTLVPCFAALERWVPPPVGQSLFAVATRPGT